MRHEKAFTIPLVYQNQPKEHAMKAIFSVLALAIALAFTAPAFAGDVTTAKNQADCQKAGGTWDDKMQTCSGKKM